jgi:hypothetical protein
MALPANRPGRRRQRATRSAMSWRSRLALDDGAFTRNFILMNPQKRLAVCGRAGSVRNSTP